MKWAALLKSTATEADPRFLFVPKLITVTRKNGNRNSHFMAGFLAFDQKYAQALLDMSFTVVLVTQVTPPPHVIRKVTQILVEHESLDGRLFGACGRLAREG